MDRWWKQVAEYTVVANAFNAEYGGFGSWFTTVTMKSGTNAVHGKVYDYFGNDKLNARSFFQGPVKQKLRQNEGGFQVGGPVYIPKIYDGRNKTFLFFGQGLYYARLGGAGGLQTVPRTDFKTGDFSNFVDATGAQIPIFDPATTRARRQRQLRSHSVSRKRHSGHRISPVSAKIVSLMPTPDSRPRRPITGTTGPALFPTSTPLLPPRSWITAFPPSRRSPSPTRISGVPG